MGALPTVAVEFFQDFCTPLEMILGFCVSDHIIFSFTIIFTDGEGNGTPLQYSHLENPMGGGVW